MRRCLWIAPFAVAVVLMACVALAAGGGSEVARVGLAYGDTGEAVVDLQRLLHGAGFDPGQTDGIFGPKTLAAVRNAQAQLGLDVDGIAGLQTVAALDLETNGAQRSEETAVLGERDDGLVFYRATPATADGEHAETNGQFISAYPSMMALTFNGVPDPDLLPTILDVLSRQGMKATFFVEGQTAEQMPEALADIAAAGHEIAASGYTVLNMTRLTDQMARAQLLRTSRAIEQATGKSPQFFRPPDGQFNRKLINLAAELHMPTVLWANTNSQDLANLPAELLVERLSSAVYPGAVIRIHQDHSNTVQSLELLLKKLRRNGYQSVNLSNLLLTRP